MHISAKFSQLKQDFAVRLDLRAHCPLLSREQQTSGCLKRELAAWQANLMQQSIRIYSLYVSHKQTQLFPGEAAALGEAV